MYNYKRWSKNIKSIAFTKTPGNCPKCNSDDTDYATKIIDVKTSIGYMVIWCNECKGNIFISDMKIEKDSHMEKTIPEDIVYE